VTETDRIYTVWIPSDGAPLDKDEALFCPRQIEAACPEEAAERYADIQCGESGNWLDNYLFDGVTLFVESDSVVTKVRVQGVQSTIFLGRKVDG